MHAHRAESTAPKIAPLGSSAGTTSATALPIASFSGRPNRAEARSPISTTTPFSSTTIWPCSKLRRISAGSTLLIADLPQSRSHTPYVTPDFGHRLVSTPHCGLQGQIKGPYVGHQPAVPTRLELPQASQRMPGTRVRRDPPQVVLGVPENAHLLDGVPVEEVRGYEVATVGRGRPEEVGGPPRDPQHNDPRQRPPVAAGEVDPAAPVRRHQLVDRPVVRLPRQLNAVSRRRLFGQLGEGADVVALLAPDTLFLCHPHVVARLWFELGQDLLGFGAQVDDRGVFRLHRRASAPRWRRRPAGLQLGLDRQEGQAQAARQVGQRPEGSLDAIRLQGWSLGDIPEPPARHQGGRDQQADRHGQLAGFDMMALDLPSKSRLQLTPSMALQEVRVGHRAERGVPGDRVGGFRQATRSALRRCRLSLMAMTSSSGVTHRAASLGPLSTVIPVLSTAPGKRRLPAGMPTISDRRQRRTPMWVTTATVESSPPPPPVRPKHTRTRFSKRPR